MAKQRLLGVKLNNKAPKFLHVDRDTSRYLGIELSLSLNWKKQYAAVIASAQEAANKVMSSCLAPEHLHTGHHQAQNHLYLSHWPPMM